MIRTRVIVAVVLGLVLGLGGCGAPTIEPTAPAPPASGSLANSGPILIKEPTRIEIPTIGVAADLIQTGQKRPGVLEVPERLADASWWRDSARPGQPAPAVILGHTANDGRRGVFAKLGTLKAGALVWVMSGDQVRRFVVQRVAQTAKSAFPEDVTAPTTGPALRLVSCTGDIDTATNRHTDNVIVYAQEEPQS